MKCPNCDCELELSLVQKTYEDSTESVSDKAIETIKEAEKGDRILWDEKNGIVKNLDKIDIHAENKKLLDKDYGAKK